MNQLFWKRRKVFDRLLDAARRLRVEHGRQLSGKAAEVDAAEAHHRDALRAATDEVRDLLEAAGEQDTPATMLAVSETLQGLPGRSDHGRLVRPLKPAGFEALTGLVSGRATLARLAEVRPAPPPSKATRKAAGASADTKKEDAARRKRESQARAKEISAAERALRKAELEERATRAEFSRAEMTLARLQRERRDLQERIDAVTSRRDQAAIDLDNRKRAAERASAERKRVEEHLQKFRER